MNPKLKKQFAWLPIRRWVRVEGTHYFECRGWYWLRWVNVMRAGLCKEWTAYSHYNDAQAQN